MFAHLSAPSLPGLNMEEVLTSASERSACAADANAAAANGQTPPWKLHKSVHENCGNCCRTADLKNLKVLFS